MAEPHHLTRRSLYTLILILITAAYMRVSAPVFYAGQSLLDPLATAINVANVGLLWWTARRYFGFVPALVAGFMFALSPWTMFAASSAQMSLTLVLPTLTFAFALLGYVENKSWAKIMTILVLVPTLIVLTQFAGSTSFPSDRTRSTALDYSARIAAGLIFHDDGIPTIVPRPGTLWLLFLGSITVLGVPAVWLRNRVIFAALAVWFALTVILYFRAAVASETYLLPLLPALCILAGAGIAWLIHLLPGKPYSRMIVLAAYGAIFLSQGLWWLAVARYLSTQ